MQPVAHRRPSPALLVAVIALVAALAGSASALQGKNTVDKNDIKKNAVKSKTIKNGQVKSVDIADGQVADADIADSEPRQIVGAGGTLGTGGTPFSNGGEGDCIWSSAHTEIPGFEPVSFYKDPAGLVHMTGIATSEDGPGGDADCDSSAEAEDAFIFTLPPGYRPGNGQIQGLGATGLFFIAPDQGLSAPPTLDLPPGVVAMADTGSFQQAGFDGTVFRTDPAGTATAPESSTKASGSVLRHLID